VERKFLPGTIFQPRSRPPGHRGWGRGVWPEGRPVARECKGVLDAIWKPASNDGKRSKSSDSYFDEIQGQERPALESGV
jgi:hypothetical protein